MSEFTAGRYAAVVKESGEGCDYTIGCAEKTFPLAAATLEEAKREIAALLQDGYGYPDRDGGLEHVLIVTVGEVMTQDAVYALMESDEEVEDGATAERRRLYESLKKEFG